MNQQAEEALHHLHEAMAYQAELLTPLDWDTWPQVCMAITKGKGTGKGNDNHAKGKGTGKGKDNHDAAALDHDALETLAALLNDHGTPLRIRRLRRYTNGEHGQPAQSGSQPPSESGTNLSLTGGGQGHEEEGQGLAEGQGQGHEGEGQGSQGQGHEGEVPASRSDDDPVTPLRRLKSRKISRSG